MNFCEQCGSRLVRGARFCTACGSPVPPAGPSVRPGRHARAIAAVAAGVAVLAVAATTVGVILTRDGSSTACLSTDEFAVFSPGSMGEDIETTARDVECVDGFAIGIIEISFTTSGVLNENRWAVILEHAEGAWARIDYASLVSGIDASFGWEHHPDDSDYYCKTIFQKTLNHKDLCRIRPRN